MRIPFYRASLRPFRSLFLIAGALFRKWITSGPIVESFEREVRAYLKSEQIIAVSSGTAALQIALKTFDFLRGSEIILPANTFIATFEVVIQENLLPVIVDIDPRSWNASLEAIENKISNKTRGILYVPFAGMPGNMPELKKLSLKHNLTLILDSAHALESSCNGKYLQEFADAACYSLYATKNLTTAEGGLVSFSDPQKVAIARQLSLHGMSRNAWKRYSGGTWQYDIEYTGLKANLSDIHAAIGLPQVKYLNKNLRKRKQKVLLYQKLLGNLVEYQESECGEGGSAHHLFVVRFRSSEQRQLVEHSFQKNGIAYSKHFIPLYKFSIVQKTLLNIKNENFLTTEQFFEQSLTLPLYPSLKNKHIYYICNIIKTTLKDYNENK